MSTKAEINDILNRNIKVVNGKTIVDRKSIILEVREVEKRSILDFKKWYDSNQGYSLEGRYSLPRDWGLGVLNSFYKYNTPKKKLRRVKKKKVKVKDEESKTFTDYVKYLKNKKP